MSIPNAGPDIPYVTTVPTSYIGPSVSVAGVLWVWDGVAGYRPVSAYALLPAIKAGKQITANVIGDSLSYNHSASQYTCAWWQRVEQLSRRQIQFSYAHVVSGSNIDYHLSAFPANAGTHPADVCFIEVLTNNLNIYTAKVCAEKMYSLCSMARAYGQEPIVIGIGPIGTYTTRRLASYYINEAVREMCLKNGIMWFNPFECIRDPLTGGYMAAYETGAYHFNANATGKIASSLLDMLGAGVGGYYSEYSSQNAVGADINNADILLNTAFADSNSDGLPDLWTLPVPENQTAGIAVDTADNKRRLVVTGVPGTAFAAVRQATGTGAYKFAIGDIVDFEIPIDISAVGTGGMFVWIMMYFSNGVVSRRDFYIPDGDFSGVLAGSWTVPATLDVNYAHAFEIRSTPTVAGYTSMVVKVKTPRAWNRRRREELAATYIG